MAAPKKFTPDASRGFKSELQSRGSSYGVDWPKLLGVAALTGLTVSFGKGLAEKSLERGVKKLFKTKATSTLPWAVSRGLTGAAAGSAYAGATAYGLKKKKVGKK